jgi:hypothetical protein
MTNDTIFKWLNQWFLPPISIKATPAFSFLPVIASTRLKALTLNLTNLFRTFDASTYIPEEAA